MAVIAKKSPNDYIFDKPIGDGSFSTVYLARDVKSSAEFAIKVCEKALIQREKKSAAIMRERQILKILTDHPSPLFIKLICTFQDNDRLYFVMNYAKNGELLPFINKVGSFDEQCTQFYSAEILLALEHLHKLGIIHRDLKPENILLNENMHIQLTDFGSAKIISNDNIEGTIPATTQSSNSNEQKHRGRKNSFVGTAHYISPELLTNKAATKSCDLWAFGCIVYQMISGLPPFRGPNEYLIFQKIIHLEYDFPDGFNEAAVDLVKNILQLNPTQRLGANDEIAESGYVSIKNHVFYKSLQNRWSSLHTETPPRLSPYLPANANNEELRSDFTENTEPGLADRQISRLLGLALHEPEPKAKSILDISPNEMKARLKLQKEQNLFDRFVQENLILKHGFVDKRKGLFARRRMLLLTTGPHLYYVDPSNMVLKGQIPWSADLRPEPKNFKTFFVHTPNRTYFLEDPEGGAPEWCRVIEEVRRAKYGNITSNSNTNVSNSSQRNNTVAVNDRKTR